MIELWLNLEFACEILVRLEQFSIVQIHESERDRFLYTLHMSDS